MEEEMPVPEKSEGRIFPDLESRPGIFDSGRGDQRNSEIVEFVVDFFEVLKDARTFQICRNVKLVSMSKSLELLSI